MESPRGEISISLETSANGTRGKGDPGNGLFAQCEKAARTAIDNVFGIVGSLALVIDVLFDVQK